MLALFPSQQTTSPNKMQPLRLRVRIPPSAIMTLLATVLVETGRLLLTVPTAAALVGADPTVATVARSIIFL